MFTQQEYLSAWGIYLLATAIFLIALWRLLAMFRWREIKILLVLPVAAFFLFPWSISQGSEYLSPAWIAAILESLLQGDGEFGRAGAPLLIATVVALLAASTICLVSGYIGAKEELSADS